MKKQLFAACLALSSVLGANAQQDQHFSMFSESQVYLNPAVAGFMQGDLQLFTNFRLQWSTASDNPYRTISASTDWRMFDRGGSFMGAGVNFYNDVAGVMKYQTNIIQVPLNYALKANQNHYVSFGLQPGFYQRVINNTAVNWDSQWNGVEFDQSLNSNEVLLSQNLNVSRFDIAAGVFWDGSFSRNARIKLGVSGQHLTKQRVNVINEDERLYRKLNIHGQGLFKKDNSNLTIMPAFVAFLQGPNKEITAGSNFKFQLKSASRSTSYFEEVSLSLGSYFRVGDAVIVNAIFQAAGFSVGASYDFTVSGLTKATKGVGAMEFFLRYQIEFGTRSLSNNRVK